MICLEIVSLSDLMSCGISRKSFKDMFNGFTCERDDDVCEFLRRRALKYERSAACRTYLAFERNSYENQRLELVAFFSLAITAVDCSDISLDMRKGILGKIPYAGTNSHFPGHLLAQLARDDRYSSEDVCGRDLVALAEEYIDKAHRIIGGNNIYLDCKDELCEYYASLGYTMLSNSTNGGLNTMFKRLTGE